MSRLQMLIKKADEAILGNKMDDAFLLYTEVLQIQPNYLPGLFNLALMQEKSAKFLASAEFYERIALLPQDEVEARWMNLYEKPKSKTKVFYWAGLELMRRREFSGALRKFQHSLDTWPQNIPALYHVGLCHLQCNNALAASDYFLRLLKEIPSHVDAWFNLGNAYQLLGSFFDAERCYLKALELEPDLAEAYYNLGQLCKATDIDKGNNYCNKALRLKPHLQLPTGEINDQNPHLKARYWRDCKLPDDFRETPIFVNCRDKLSPLKLLLDWLARSGYRNIILIDNASTYPPLLAYYESLKDEDHIEVVRLGENLGHKALWKSNLIKTRGIKTPFVYTDPDIIPIEECPSNVVEVFYRILMSNPYVQKVGFGLKIDDIPDHYSKKNQIIEHESQFWSHRISDETPEQYIAPIDTTFALYRHGNYYEICNDSIRTGYPFLARHSDWYINTSKLTEEELYYFQHADKSISTTKQSLDIK